MTPDSPQPPAEPAEPAGPVGPDGPAEPAGPAGSAGPAELAGPAEPVAPGTASAAHPPSPALASPSLPPRTRGVIALLEANCTVCMICARECPDWCIHIDSHTEVEQQPGSARPRARNVLDRFAIDYGQCLYCGICVEACPFDALHWAPDFSYPGTGTLDGHGAVAELVHERDVLNMWVQHVPPPPALDIQAEPAPETGATRPGRAGSGTPGRPGALRGRT